MIWKTCRLRVASRPATTITTMAVSQPDIQAAAFLGECSKDMRDEAILARPRRRSARRTTPPSPERAPVAAPQRLAPLAGPATLAAGDGATGAPAGELIDACRS